MTNVYGQYYTECFIKKYKFASKLVKPKVLEEN